MRVGVCMRVQTLARAILQSIKTPSMYVDSWIYAPDTEFRATLIPSGTSSAEDTYRSFGYTEPEEASC
jgi:hypothetical protein